MEEVTHTDLTQVESTSPTERADVLIMADVEMAVTSADVEEDGNLTIVD